MIPDYDQQHDAAADEQLYQRAQPIGSIRHETQSRSWMRTLVIAAFVLLFAMITAAAAFGGGFLVGRETTTASDVNVVDEARVFSEAWQVVQDNYVQEEAIDEDVMLEAAIEGMLDTLGDQGHTRYLTPREVALDEQNSRGVYVGVGIQVVGRDEGLTVVRTFPGGDAREQGVLPGDIILAVDGEDVTDLPLEEVVQRIRGPEGSTVELTIERPDTGETMTYELERREIEVSAVSWTMLEGNVALLRLEQFQSRAADDLADALQEALENDPDGIILDLRNNPGGFVNEAVQIASMFVPEDSTIFIRETRQGGREEQKAEDAPVRLDPEMELVVLVNGGTASASEIVAGAIQSSGTGTVIGEQTVGTGTVLRKFTLEDGSAIWLGVELWLTPEGDMIRDDGITPDITVSLAEGQFPYEPNPLHGDVPSLDQLNDEQLEFALDLIEDAQDAAVIPSAIISARYVPSLR